MDEKVIQEQFMKGFDCSQVVLSHFAGELGITEEVANKMAACFGGGMMQADACGAFTGALMAIGLKYGHYDPENLAAQKGVMMEKCGAFKEQYLKLHPSCRCLDLIGYNVTTPEGFQRAIDSGDMMNICPRLVREVIEILDEIIGK